MNNASKTVAAVAAAAVLGGGVVAINEYLSEPEKTDGVKAESVVDDVQPVTVEVPRVAIPRVEIPRVAVPGVVTVRILSPLELEELGIPAPEMPSVDATEFPPVSVAPSSAETPGVASYTSRMPDLIALQKLQGELFRDQRNLMYDPAVGIDSASWTKWIKIYQSAEYKNYSPEFVELAPGLRIITEVKCPENTEQFQCMIENLEYYQSRGYNAVLVTFTTGEPLYRLADTIDYLKSCGLTVIIAYAGRENLNESLFRDPDTLAKFLRELGAKADALLLGWGRTSLHLFLPDRSWTNFLIKNARSKNSRLGVVGMAYFGETAEKQIGVTYDVPENCSAVLIVGLGFPGASTKTTLKKLFPEIVDHPHKIGLVVGERPYFDSLHNTGKTKKQNDQIKRRIELRIMQAGCSSTMTYSGDGSDGQYGRKDRTENLCLPYGK